MTSPEYRTPVSEAFGTPRRHPGLMPIQEIEIWTPRRFFAAAVRRMAVPRRIFLKPAPETDDSA